MKKPRQKAVRAPQSVGALLFMAFSVDHASRVTGLTKARLTRWDKLGFFSPEHLDDEDRGNPYCRVYSFRDLVGLRTLKVLIDSYRVPLAELRKAAVELEQRADRPWEKIPLAVLNRKVVFDLDTSPRDADGQRILRHIPLPTIAAEVAKRADELRNRDSDKIGMIERRPFVAHNAPVIAGTRIPARAVESFLADGYSDKEIMAEYPSVTRLDIAAVRNWIRAAA